MVKKCLTWTELLANQCKDLESWGTKMICRLYIAKKQHHLHKMQKQGLKRLVSCIDNAFRGLTLIPLHQIRLQIVVVVVAV